MQRSRILILLAAVALVASACRSNSEAGTSTAPPVTTPASSPAPTTTLPLVAVPMFPGDDELVEADPEVTIGVLDNGLTYYIRRNTRPGSRAQLRLAVAAGSALEDDDQRGVAHYLEHMMFNGTESFPANELIRVLERFGSEFGPDINAYTNLDQTVYELEVPTDAAGNLESAFDVLYEWSSLATIDPAEVDAERSVLLEEWRLRSQSFSGRYFDAVAEVLLAGSAYEGHDPLADGAELDATSAETLRRFYEDWYRPDLMAVVAVGDFEVTEVEQLIKDRFGALDMPANPRSRPHLTTDPASTASFVVLPDPESPSAFVELNYPLPASPNVTVGDGRRELALSLAFDMIITRLDEDSRISDAPFFNPSFAANPFVDGQRTPGLAAFAEPSDLEATATALLEEVRRTLLHGFSADELARAVARFRGQADLNYEGRSSRQDSEYAAAYVANYLQEISIPSAKMERDLVVRALDEMTADQAADTFRATIETTEPLVIVAGPASARAEIPDEQVLAGVVEAAAAADVPARESSDATVDQLMARPDPVDIVTSAQLGRLRPTVLELANGVRVAYVESDIAADTVSMQAVSPGGWLLLPDEDATEAQLVGSVVAESGVAELDQVALSRFLSGDLASVFTYIDEAEEGMVGSAEADDLELLFQLIHLYFTEPRAEQRAWESLFGELRPLAFDREAVPFLALADQLQQSRYRRDPRYLPVPTVAELDSFDLPRALEVQQDRFTDASDFVFAFAGDFDGEEFEDLAARYLGTLPSAGVTETAGTGQPAAPDGVVFEVVDSGDGELGAVLFQFTNEIPITNELQLTLVLLESVLDQRLTALLREELGATYSPFVTASVQSQPVELVEILVQVTGDPEGLQGIADALEADLSNLVANGPTTDQFAIAQEQTTRNYELIDNQFWLDTMTTYVANPDLDPDDVADRIPDTMALIRADVQLLAEQVLRLDDYIRIDLVPAG